MHKQVNEADSRQETRKILHSSHGGPAQMAGWRRSRHLNERAGTLEAGSYIVLISEYIIKL